MQKGPKLSINTAKSIINHAIRQKRGTLDIKKWHVIIIHLTCQEQRIPKLYWNAN